MVIIEPPKVLHSVSELHSGDIAAQVRYYPNGMRISTYYHVVKVVQKARRCTYVVCVHSHKSGLYSFHNEDIIDYQDDNTKLAFCYAWERSTRWRYEDWIRFVRYLLLEAVSQRKEKKEQKK